MEGFFPGWAPIFYHRVERGKQMAAEFKPQRHRDTEGDNDLRRNSGKEEDEPQISLIARMGNGFGLKLNGKAPGQVFRRD